MSERNVSDKPLTATDDERRSETLYLQSLAICLVLLPLIGYLAPRSLALAPGLIGVIGFSARWYIYKSRPLLDKGAIYIVAPIILLALASVSWTIAPAESWERCLKLIPVLISGVAYLSVLQIYGARLLPIVTRLFPLVTVFALALALIDHMSHGAIYSLLRGLPLDEEFNVSELNRGVIVLILCLIPTYALMRYDQDFWNLKRCRVYMALILCLLVGIIFTTDSQSAHLIIAVCTVFWFLFPVTSRAAWYGLWALLTASIFTAPWLAQYMFNAMPALIGDIEWFQQSYALNRLEIWDYIGRYIEANPYYGFGIEVTRSIDNFDSAFLYDEKATVLHPHNFALQFWIEFGVIGAAFSSVLIGYILRALMQMEAQYARLGLVVFMGLLCPAATAYGLWQGWFIGLFFMMSGYCVVFMQSQSRALRD